MRTIILFFGILLISCQSDNGEVGLEQDRFDQKDSVKTAVDFINDYIGFINDLDREIDLVEWVEQRQDVTDSFKEKLIKLVDQAKNENPNMGLGFDPVLNAQDSPDNFKYISSSGEYITLEGIDWSEFKIVLKLKKQDEKWMIDGSGIVNIPKDKMIER